MWPLKLPLPVPLPLPLPLALPLTLTLTLTLNREVAYAGTGGYPDGYGTYREGCSFNAGWNAWVCSNASIVPARLRVRVRDAVRVRATRRGQCSVRVTEQTRTLIASLPYP